MLGLLVAIFISIIIPLVIFVYACKQKRYIPFIYGMIAFTVSQVLIRIPALQYLQSHSVEFTMFSMMQPVIFALVIGLSAGIFEETTRYIIMRFLMKKLDFQSGVYFGAGHGSIEAILLLGVSTMAILFSDSMEIYQFSLLAGGIERLFAIVLHIGLSVIVLYGVVQLRLRYLIMAILIHGLTNTAIILLPSIISPSYTLLIIELFIAIIALMVLGYAVNLKRSGRLL